MTDKRKYFGYGSNLNVPDWEQWCQERNKNPNLIRPCENGYLPDWELVFNHYSNLRGAGALNLQPRFGQIVAGVIFDVEEEGWKLLDRKEGAPKSYQQIPATALTVNGEETPVLTYRVCREDAKFVHPTEDYLDIVKKGLVATGLDDKMLMAVSDDHVPELALTHLFVYGTLMQGEERFHLLDEYELLGIQTAKAPGRLLDLGSFPGMIAAKKDGDWVHGELLHVRRIDQALREIDRIEGFKGFGQTGSFFRRAIIQVETGDGRLMPAWTYRYNQETYGRLGKPIPSGSWKSRSRTER